MVEREGQLIVFDYDISVYDYSNYKSFYDKAIENVCNDKDYNPVYDIIALVNNKDMDYISGEIRYKTDIINKLKVYIDSHNPKKLPVKIMKWEDMSEAIKILNEGQQ